MSKLIEEWRPIEGYEGLYEVSDWGNVKSLNYNKTKKEKKLSLVVNNDGYLIVCLHKDGKQKEGKVHRLVSEAFIPNQENKPQVDHINGDKTDNRVDNLRWATPLENNNNPNTIVNMRGIQNGRQLNRQDLSKKVLQYDMDWNLINEYPSESEACRQLGFHIGSIGKSIKRGVNKVFNYYFKYGN